MDLDIISIGLSNSYYIMEPSFKLVNLTVDHFSGCRENLIKRQLDGVLTITVPAIYLHGYYHHLATFFER